MRLETRFPADFLNQPVDSELVTVWPVGVVIAAKCRAGEWFYGEGVPVIFLTKVSLLQCERKCQ